MSSFLSRESRGPLSSKVGRRTLLLSAAGATTTLLAACSSSAPTPGQSAAKATTSAAPTPTPTPSTTPAAVTVSPAHQSTEVNPITPIKVTAEGGRLSAVTVTDQAGNAVKGEFSADKTSWTSAGRLAFDSAYTVSYTPEGAASASQSTFSTTTPAMEFDAYAYPPKNATVGVGMPIQITFSEPVLNKKDVEKAITITSTSGQEGRFFWLTDKVVRYRPEKFWAPNSTITVSFKLFGVEAGGGMVGNFDADHVFHTHNVRHAIISDKDLILNVFIDGKNVGSYPSTLGTERWPSADGIFPIMDQARRQWFRAESIGLKPGDEDYYEPFQYEYTSRLTTTGVFVHKVLDNALPLLGNSRISHGCIGLSEAGAKFIFENFDAGDVIEVRDTGNGGATIEKGWMDWNIPWSEYGV